jgi:hypothetical protein
MLTILHLAQLLLLLCIYIPTLHQDVQLPRKKRVINAMSEIGPSILFGACTFVLGTLPLAAAQSTVFQILFRCVHCHTCTTSSSNDSGSIVRLEQLVSTAA